MPDSITAAILFFSLLIGGEAFLIPALFAGMIGLFSIELIIIIALIATLLSDSVWYVLGYGVSIRHKRIPGFITRRIDRIPPSLRQAGSHIPVLVIVSKFVYGTRTIMQLYAGLVHYPYWKYVSANMLGAVLWISFLLIIGYALRFSYTAYRDGIVVSYVVLTIVVVGSIGTLLVLRKYTRRWFQ